MCRVSGRIRGTLCLPSSRAHVFGWPFGWPFACCRHSVSSLPCAVAHVAERVVCDVFEWYQATTSHRPSLQPSTHRAEGNICTSIFEKHNDDERPRDIGVPRVTHPHPTHRHPLPLSHTPTRTTHTHTTPTPHSLNAHNHTHTHTHTHTYNTHNARSLHTRTRPRPTPTPTRATHTHNERSLHTHAHAHALHPHPHHTHTHPHLHNAQRTTHSPSNAPSRARCTQGAKPTTHAHVQTSRRRHRRD